MPPNADVHFLNAAWADPPPMQVLLQMQDVSPGTEKKYVRAYAYGFPVWASIRHMQTA